MFSPLVWFVGGSVVVVGVGVGVGGLTNSGIEHSPEVFKTNFPPDESSFIDAWVVIHCGKVIGAKESAERMMSLQ